MTLCICGVCKSIDRGVSLMRPPNQPEGTPHPASTQLSIVVP